MYFDREEKVFSLAGTASALQRTNLALTWQEFFGYLIVAGLYLEGRSHPNNSDLAKLSQPKFELPYVQTYAFNFSRTIAKGLSERWYVLHEANETSDEERGLLEDMVELFLTEGKSFKLMKAGTFLKIAAARELSPAGMVFAHYASIMFGQTEFAEPTKIPKLYISRFGNIHLSKSDEVTFGSPALVYGSSGPNQEKVTALWALFSAIKGTVEEYELAPDQLFFWLSQLAFLSEDACNWDARITFPQAAAAASAAATLGLCGTQYNQVVTKFYHSLVWRGEGKTTILNWTLFKHCLNLMIPEGCTSEQLADFSSSEYKSLLNPTVSSSTASSYRDGFDLALEALDATPVEEEENKKELTTSMGSDSKESAEDEVVAPDSDPEHDVTAPADGESDPAVPPPAPTQGDVGEKDTIGLISFDTTGEGIDADLYRSAVLALRERLQSDDSVPVTAEIKDSLNYWVNSFLYRASISATQTQIETLGLQRYLKNVATKGK